MHLLLMRTMTPAETGHTTGVVSLASLLRGERPPRAESDLGRPAVVARLVTGGWPG